MPIGGPVSKPIDKAAVRTVVSTERINHGPGTFAMLLKTVTA